MKTKIIIAIFIILILTGCINKKTPKDIVTNYLNSYKNLDSFIKDEVDKVIDENDEFNDEHKTIYKEILLNQYKTLEFTIIDEEIEKDKALVRVNITVNDLNLAEEKAFNTVSKNLANYYVNEDEFDNNKYIMDKLNIMKNTKERKDYEITFYLEYKNNEWFMHDPSDEDLEKIHGIYILKES